MTTSRRLAPLPLLLIALAALCTLLFAPEVQAQTATVLVKNTDQTTHSPLGITTRAQGFTTGTAPSGYNLASIGVLFDQIADVSEAPNVITATINEVNGTEPGTVFCTLGHPSAYVADSVNTYDASGCSTLSPNTTYFVILTRTDTPVGGNIFLERTSSDDEDGTPATGWSIADIRHYFISGSWTTAPDTHLIEIRGAAVPDPPKRVTGFDLHSSNSDPRGMWGNEDTFWVVNDTSGSGTADKLYAYNRSDVSRDTTNDFDNLNGANNNRPWGICSDGTTMFVGDRDDDKLYAYKMSDTTSDSTKDITLDSGNGEPRGMWCDATTVYVANDGATSANKVFAYTISTRAHDSSKDFEQLYVSTNTAAQNAETPRGVWSNGTTMFVADSDDDNVFAYKHSDESQDSGKNLALSSANDNPNGMWFDGRILWVVDDTDDMIYPYDLPGAQPENTPAAGDPRVDSTFTKDVFRADVSPGETDNPRSAAGYSAVADVLSIGSITKKLFALDEVTYTVRAVFDGNRSTTSGDLILELDRELPRRFTITADGVSYSSDDATESEPGTARYEYKWTASLGWEDTDSIPVVLSVETPKDGEEVSADVSGITDSTDGVARAHFEYQWVRVDGTDETDIDGETGSTYTPTAADVDKHLKVRVVFDDDAGYLEYPRTSPQFGPVVDTVPPTYSTDTATATTISILFTKPLDPASTPAASAFAVQVGDTANTVVSAEIGDIDFLGDIFPGALILTVSTPMLSRDTITVTYTKPAHNPLQGPDRNEVESFSGTPVVNTIRETFVSNLGQTVATFLPDLSANDLAQRFDTGSTASFEFTEVEVLFSTAPSSSATVTAIIADGLGLSNNIVATLTNPQEWSTNARFGIPDGTTLSKDTTYHLIIEATEGVLQTTISNNEDSGAAANWTIGNAVSIRTMVSDTGLGGTWPNSPTSASLQVAIRGKHHGNPGTPELAVTAKDQALVLDVTVPDHGSSDLTGIEYRYKETTGGTYTGWTSVTETVSNSGGTFEIGGLTNGTEHTVQVQTVNDIGTSDPSNEDSATPDAPPAVTAIAITSTPANANTYIIGEEIEFTVTFDKDLSLGGTNTAKAPGYITYQTDYTADTAGVDSPEANCEIGTNTKTIVCTDPIEEPEYDTDGIFVFANALRDQANIVHFAGPLGQRANLAHAALPVDANHKIDGVRPELTGARPSADKTKITLTFSEAIGAVDRMKITFDSGGTTLTTTAHSTSGSEVEITLTTALTTSDTNVTVALAADAVTDAVGNGNAVLAASPIVDETAPTLSMTSTPSNTEVLLTYNEPLDADSIPGTSAFTVKVGGTARTVSTAALSGTSGIVLTLSPAFRPGDALTVSYTVPPLNPIQDIAGNDAAALTDEAVSNTLPATAPEAVASLTASNTSTFGEVQLDWSGGTWANGSPITRHEVRYRDHTLIWSATLTVKDLGSNFLGCDTSVPNLECEPGELLTDNTFSYDSVDYLIDSIDLIGGQLRLITNKSTIPAAALADLTLHVGGLSFPFADAAHSSGTLTWTGTGLSWSEDDMVPLAIRAFTRWTSISNSAPGEANETSHTLEGLDPGEEYTFQVRAVNDIGGGGEASDTLTLLAPEWEFTLRDSGGNDITELTEGGDSATATVTITNASQATFGADQTVTLEWDDATLLNNRIQGAGNTSTITITAGASSGSLEINSPQSTFSFDAYDTPLTGALTATHGTTEIGSIDLTRLDDEDPPVATITEAPTTVNEGEDIEVEISLDTPFSFALVSERTIKFAVNDADNTLSGTAPTSDRFSSNQTTITITLTAAENTTQNDGAHDVTFALQTNPDSPYTLGDTSSVTIIVQDDDTPPLAVGNLRAQAGNTEATLRWEAPPAPTPDHGQPILHYEYRVKEGAGSFGSWAMIPNSDGTTTSHKFTGLTNGTEYTYEVRAENVAGDGAEADVSVTPRVGVAVSFGAATASITEGGSAAVTLTLAEVPATGTTVVVPITATRGAGLAATEYSGVPANVTFAAGETSKSFTVAAADDALDEPDEELTLELGTLPDGYVPGTNAEIVITVVDDDVAEWGFTLTGSNGNAVTELTEGGASATATVSITNSVRFETDQTVTLEWGGQEITSGLIQGAGGSATITITAGQSSGTLAVSAPQRPGDLYRPPETGTLTAMLGGAQIGGGIELAYADDEDPPVLTIRLRDSRVVENGSAFLDGTLSRGYDTSAGFVPLHALATGATARLPILALNAVDGQPTAPLSFEPGQTTSLAMSMTPTGNSTAGDHATITFTIPSNPDYYTIGTPSTATLLILDDDDAPGAPRNPTARPGDTEATLSWDHPGTYDQIWVSDYQYRQRAGTGPWTSWAAVPDSDGETTSHTFTGLTNETEYTFEIRGRNSNHNGAVAQVMVTPREGIAVSFAAGSVSITEGGSATVTLTLAEAPAAGATVMAEITATRGAGLGATEYAGVPASVTFNAGETSKSFMVTTVDNTDDEPHRVLTLGLGELPEGYVTGTHHEFVLTLLDDDVPVVSATFDPASASVPEGAQFVVTVRLSQAPEREVALTLTAARGANLEADEFSGVPAAVTFAADATEAVFTVTFGDDAAVEGNETLTLAFETLPDRVNSAGANPQLVLTVTDDDGPPAATDVSVQTGDGYAELSWAAVTNDSPVLRYEVRWRESDGGTFNVWQSAGTETSYRVEGLTNGKAHEFEVRAVNLHGDGEEVSAPGTPTARLTGIPKAVQVLQVKATDSSRAELSWTRPSNGTDKVTANSATATFSQIQGYRIEVCRTVCGEEANWYALVPNTRNFEHKYVHQVLAPGVIRENHYRVQAININGKTGPWSNVATLDRTVVENVYLQTPDDSTLWVRFRVLNPDGNKLYVRYTNTGTGSMGNAEPYRLTKKGDVKLDLTGLEADSWYRVDIDFSADFNSARRQSRWYGTAKAGHTPLTSPYAVDALDAQVFAGGVWRDASDTALYVRMGGTGKYRVRLKPCQGIHDVIVHRIQAPAGRLRASPMETDPVLFTNLNCESEFDDWRRDEHGEPLTMDQVYDMTNFPDRAKDLIPIYAGTPNNWHEVTVTARALEDYPADRRYDALLSAPFAVVYNHGVWKEVTTSSSYLVSDGTGLVRVLVDRPADAVLPVPGGVTIGSDRVMTWDAVSGATGYLVEWRHGPQYSDRANQNRSLQTATSVTLPPGASGRGPVTARVRAYSSSGVSAWSPERTWDSRPPTLNVLDTAVNEADGSVGFLVTLDPAATGVVTVQYTTVDATAVAPTDYAATSGTLTFAPGDTRKQTALVPIVNDGEEDTGETFRLVLSNPTGSDANNGAAVLGDAEAVATILNSEREASSLTGFTLVDAGTNADLMALADSSTVELGDLLASSYGIRAEMSAGAAPGSVRLALTGAKTVTRTDDAAPWSLYGDGAGRVNGGSLPPGSYTLTATAYADSGGRGAELGSLEVSFTVAAGALAVTTAGPFTVAEGETAVAALAASDTGTGATAVWSIPAGAAGGADGAAFAVTSEGMLLLVATKDFEAPDDADGDGTYEVTVAVAVPASSMAGAQSATAALLVTLSDVNEAPVAQASASQARVREGARVTLDGSASTDPDAGDTLTYLWTQADDGAPRVTLSDGSAEQPAFTSPSDLAAETELAFTLRVTDADGLYAEDTLSVAVTLISEVSISAASNYATEGAEAVFRLTRAGSARAALTVPVTVEETGAMLGTAAPADATFAAGARETELRVPTAADAAPETDSRVTARLASGSGWQLAPGAEAASVTVLDDDAAPETETAAADVTIWSADMTVVEYSPRSIGAGSADLLSNQMGRAGLRAKYLWYDPSERVLRLGFDAGLYDAEPLTLHVGDVSLGFPENTGGDASFTLEGVDLSWTDGETLEARISKPSASAVSTDAALASLGVEGATLSPAFDARVLLYWAVADAGAETVSVSAQANDDGATVAYGPAADADAELADHQVAAPTGGEILVVVTVTAADGTVRRYRVVVAPTAAESNTAPTGAPTISGTPQVGETLTADTSAIADRDGLANVSYSYQWIRSDGNNDTDIPDATDTTYTLTVDDVGKTIQVRVTFTDDANNQERRTSEATEAVAAAEPNSEPTGLPAVNGTPQVGQTLTADTSAIDDPDGLENVSYRYQWISSKTVIDDVTGTSNILTSDVPGATNSTYTLAPADEGFTFQVKVSFTDDADYVESLTSEATVAVAPPPNTEPTGLPAVTGTPQVGETLAADTSSIDDADGLANVSYRYQWIRSDNGADTDIAGETDSTYTLVLADLGKTIKVQVSFTDDADNDETLTSEATVAVAATVPSAPQSLTVTSGSQIQELDVSWQVPSANGGSGVTGYKVQWKESADSWDTETDVSETTVTGTTHTITSLTGGVEYAVRVIATNVAGDGPASTEARATPADSPASGEEGTETVESDSTAAWTATLTVGVSGSGSEAVWGYSWFLDGMGTLDERTYSEGDQTIEVMAILLSNGFLAFNVRPHPSVDFVLTVDGTEFASADASEVKSRRLISYVWATTLDWAEDDRVALSLTLKDTDSTEQSEPAENTPSTGLPTISGTPQVGQDLTADTSAISDADGLTNVSYKYQWLAGGSEISGATGSSYELTNSEQGKTIQVRVSFTDDSDNQETLTSVATDEVAAKPNSPSMGLLTISGTPQVGEKLTAETSAIVDADGLDDVSYSYQWIRNDGNDDADIEDATVSTYTLVSVDEGNTIKVRVSFTDDSDNQETLTSVATDEVATKPNNPSTGLLTISGTPQVGETLTAETSVIADEDGLDDVSYSYQWMVNDGNDDADIEDATVSTYTLVSADRGKTIKVRVSFTDDRDHAESLTSAATAAVLASVPTDPLSLTVTRGSQIQELDASWQAPASDGGSAITGYKVQWKEAADSWDTAADVSEATVTGTTHTITGLTGGVEYAVRVIATNDVGDGLASTEAKGTPAGGVSEQNTEPTGLPTIGGTPQVGETLTADTSGIADEDGLDDVSYSYQWVAGDTDIDGATGSSYVLTSSEQGKTIKVMVSFTDNANNQETLTSVATVAIIPHSENAEPMAPIWSADMLVVEYTEISIGAATADLFSNIGGTESLQVRSLWSYTPDRDLRLAFTDGVPDAADMTLQVGDLALAFPAGSSGESSFKWTDVDVDWEDGQTIAVGIVPTSTLVDPKPNTAPTGQPTISGTPQVGERLSSDTSAIADVDGLDNVSYTYQWIAGDANIQHATGSSHTLTDDDEGKAIKVKVSFTDDANNAESLTSIPTAAVTPRPNTAATGAPSIQGVLQNSHRVTADTVGITDADGLDDSTFTYQWMRVDAGASAQIDGQTQSSYSLTSDDVGKSIQLQVRFDDDQDNAESLTSAATGLVTASGSTRELIWLAAIAPKVQDGATTVYTYDSLADDVTLSPGAFMADEDTFQTITYLGASPSNATMIAIDLSSRPTTEQTSTWTLVLTDTELPFRNATYATTTADPSAHRFQWDVTELASSTATFPEDDEPLLVSIQKAFNLAATGQPTINGAPQVDETLTADTSGIADGNGLDNVTFQYQWTADGSDIDGATGSSLTLTSSQEGQTIQLQVSFTDDDGFSETTTSQATTAVAAGTAVNNPPTGLPTVSGTPQVEVTLTTDTSAIDDADGLNNVSYRYQWIADGTDIDGATGSTYELTSSEQGQTIQVRVTFTDDRDNAETLTSVATVAVAAAPNREATGAPTVGGTPQVDQTLTADTSAIDDADGLTNVSYGYQWTAGGSDIENATGSSHLLTASEQGQTIQVKVTFTDDADNQESLTSAATLAVTARPNTAATGEPTISGTPQVDQTLTADVSGIDDVDGLTNVSYRYQWTAGGSDIENATGSSHLLTANEQGQTIQVKVTFTDDADNQESLTSAETLAVTAKPNTAATGDPTISGTPQVDETLTAGTSAISDEDGLANVAYQYQWLRDDTDIAGQTSSTYELVAADEGNTIKVRVTFRDDADNAESLTSGATTAVAARPTPAVLLTASFANMPADHNGDNFTFQLTFSENVDAGYARIRNHALTVNGATIDSASRITQGSNQGWTVEVNPTGNDAISITLPETTDCSASGAICTDDSRKLSHPTSAKVEGPPAVSVSDATVQEAEGAVLAFSVTLSHASSRTVTVDYATSDGSAQAGSDYTATSATLTFNAGDTAKAVQVPVLTDSDDEGQETLTLTLSNPSQATLDDATATGTIENGESSSGTQEDPPSEDPPADTPAVTLTAAFGGVPATHNGNLFTFELDFSVNVRSGYGNLRDDAFAVTGGKVDNAQRRTAGTNQYWLITVDPDGNGEVSITLPVTTDCNATGAICDYDDNMLSNSPSAIVAGP